MKKILNKSLLTGDKYTQRWIYINLNLHIVHVDLLLTLLLRNREFKETDNMYVHKEKFDKICLQNDVT